MPLFNNSLIRKTTLFLAAAMLSVSAMAFDFSENERLANQGDAAAQFKLALWYAKDDDYTKSVEWYKKAADNGSAGAQFNLALMYEYEVGVNQNYAEARKWYEKAANKGHADAQNNLGFMYNDGKGVRQNLITAKEWFGKSCDNGNQEGCDNYRRLNLR
jgi:TPR repeat protein